MPADGYKIHTTVLYPVHLDNKFYLIWANCRGEMQFTHPLDAVTAAESSPEKRIQVMAMPRFGPRKKKTA